MIASYILVQDEAGLAAIATACREVPGVPGTASAAGSRDVTARAGTRDTGELARLVTSPARPPAAGGAR